MFTHAQSRQWQEIIVRTVELRQTKRRGHPLTRAERDRDALVDLLETAIARVRELEQLSLFDDAALNPEGSLLPDDTVAGAIQRGLRVDRAERRLLD